MYNQIVIDRPKRAGMCCYLHLWLKRGKKVVPSALDFWIRLRFDAYLHIASCKYCCIELRTKRNLPSCLPLLHYHNAEICDRVPTLTCLHRYLQPSIAIHMVRFWVRLPPRLRLLDSQTDILGYVISPSSRMDHRSTWL